jgi:glycosyltransferase involved in cell wall biosynthesis
MKISIITPSYNQSEYLRDTIESVLTQNIHEFEYIIMDGGSNDNSPDIIKEYDNHLSYWQSCPDNGQSAAVHEGFKLSTGDILCWLNSDDMLSPGALSYVLNIFKNNINIKFLYGGCQLIDSNGNNLKILREPLFEKNWQIYIRNCIPQSSSFWRRDLYFEVNGLDINLHYAMDYELWFKFCSITTPFVLRRILSKQRQYPENKTFSNPNSLKKEIEFVNKKYFNLDVLSLSKVFFWRLHRIFNKTIRGCYPPFSYFD